MIRKIKIHKSKLITVAAILIGLLLITFLFISNITNTVALEQEVRCGMREHTHTDECYTDDVLTCTIPEHTHDKNCYLVLLDENDVNEIMEQADSDNSNSLNSVIDNVINSAISFNTSLNSQQTEAADNQNLAFDKTTVSLLNSTIQSENSIPKIKLNENINTFSPPAPADSANNTSVMSVGDEPQTDNYNANFYIYLDGSWQCIGSGTFSTPYSFFRYTPTMATDDIVAIINNALNTNYTSNSFSLYYSTSATSTSWRAASVGATNTTFGSTSSSSTARRAKYVRFVSPNASSGDDTSFSFNTVTYKYPGGRSESYFVRSGTSITLPGDNYIWTNSQGNEYNSGDSVIINSKSEFTAAIAGPITVVNIMYDVNFPDISGVTVTSVPTVSGTASSTVNDAISENSTAVIKNVSQHTVKGKLTGNYADMSRMINFKGWQIRGTDTMLTPNTSLTWSELLAYSNNGVLRLDAVWEYDPLQTASFFIRYDSVAVDTGGNVTGQDSNQYTKELFASYVGGVDLSKSYVELNELYGIVDSTADNSFTADQSIRALYGSKSEGVWLASFPKDEDVFQQLKSYASYLSVEGKPVAAEDLHSNAYAIRWYVYKCQSDAWHIDGKLVPKEGLIHVTKTFAGNKELIEKAKQGFYIDAHDESLDTRLRLDLSNYKTYDENTQKYLWEITNVEYDELWTITENINSNLGVDYEYNVYSEYNIVDSFDEQSASGNDKTVTVRGQTYALDDHTNEILRIDFTNIYNKNDSIIIKKQDSRTGAAISGAEFKLLQNGVPLTFDYDAHSDRYVYNPISGTITNLSGSSTGYFELSIENFSYDYGPITICETKPPDGYAPISDMVIGYIDTQNKNLGMISGDEKFAKYTNGILIIGNSSETTSVIVNKTWDCPETEWADVDMQLFADNKLITTLISGIAPTVTLNSTNDWSYCWDNLPVYINGNKVTYSVKETRIGNEDCKSDYSFVNWLVSYDPPIHSKDSEDKPTVTLNVTNTTKRVLLRLTKMDSGMTEMLSGAEFRLEAVDENGQPIAGEVTKTLTTGSNGTLTFDNLKCSVRYKLTETAVPNGYNMLFDPIFLTIGETGTISIEPHPYAFAGSSAFNIVICNQKAVPLPTAGGNVFLFYITGSILMALTACVIIKRYLLKRRYQKTTL
ncbi:MULTISPECIES: SpaA isopeptide-forming pilin-related protein [unclassified Ruminococcus]|uniref:SpaA isopeptide-forming pilin-related protein n=1 Tax=unclassified Ruminococcus TaxID=2608920 RepID=UPI0021092639|nr:MULTISPECIES: SpaA isopeptide-forming pilin-related protein [unclassified Ruminococcus]MCQ4023322.1 Cna B-type domain-containing protein [Ruminococcus sp. zg-924]MCQ4115689.1 Cna B-type domain-containing protein [Ruminococcus sp. zg-921]